MGFILRELACAWCGATVPPGQTGNPLAIDIPSGEVACRRGYGCARQRPENVRTRGGAEGLAEYQHDGHWYTARELADAHEQPADRVRLRLLAGWTTQDAVGPRVRAAEPEARRAARAAIAARARSAARAVRPQPSSPPVTAATARYRREHGWREEDAVTLPRHIRPAYLPSLKGKVASPSLEVRGAALTLDAWAALFGVDGPSLARSARARGLSLAEEIARRLDHGRGPGRPKKQGRAA